MAVFLSRSDGNHFHLDRFFHCWVNNKLARTYMWFLRITPIVCITQTGPRIIFLFSIAVGIGIDGLDYRTIIRYW